MEESALVPSLPASTVLPLPTSVLFLPDECLLEIYKRLPLSAMMLLACTCQRLYSLFRDDFVWEAKVAELFGRQQIVPRSWLALFRELRETPRWGTDGKPRDIVLSENDRLACRTDDPSCHAVLSERPLRGRVRFDIQVVGMEQYFQLGVCVPSIDREFATIGTDGTWVLFVAGNDVAMFVNGGEEIQLRQPPIELEERLGFAFDEQAGTLALYRDRQAPDGEPSAAPAAVWRHIRPEVHICALLGGSNVAVRLCPPSRAYPFVSAVEDESS